MCTLTGNNNRAVAVNGVLCMCVDCWLRTIKWHQLIWTMNAVSKVTRSNEFVVHYFVLSLSRFGAWYNKTNGSFSVGRLQLWTVLDCSFLFMPQNSLQWKTKEKNPNSFRLNTPKWISQKHKHKRAARQKLNIFVCLLTCAFRACFISFLSFFGCVRVHNVNCGRRCLCCVPFVFVIVFGW